MARRDDISSGAAGRQAVAIHRDVDYVDVCAMIDYLPILRREKGAEYAIAWAKTSVRSKLALLGLADAKTLEEGKARGGISSFFDRGVLLLLSDTDGAGFRARTAFKEVVERELFESSVRAVFKRTQATTEESYVPLIPR